MTKVRVFFLFLTIIFVSVVGYFAALLARGYRFDIDSLKFLANGILVAKSDSDGASIYINGDLRGATNTNIKLAPNTYNVEIKKDGYITWQKKLTIKKEEVTQVTAQLFKSAPSLSPITFDGAENPVVSKDSSKIAYIGNDSLWVMSVSSLPIGFPNEPKKITDMVSSKGTTYTFSPDGRQILLDTPTGSFVLDSGQFTPQSQRINIQAKREETIKKWAEDKKKKDSSEIKLLPEALAEVFKKNIKEFTFSPDETMVLYEASSEAKLNEYLINKLPGSSTQKEERDVKPGKKYVYDIKEDKNFLVGEKETVLYWLPTSRHLIESQKEKIIVMDYDGTNKQVVFSGNYIYPNAYPFVNASKLLILTNFGSDSKLPNLYSLSIK